MSFSAKDIRSDQYGWINSAAKELLDASRQLVESGDAALVTDEAVAQYFTAAIRLYYIKTEGEGRVFSPIVGKNDEEITPTEMLSAIVQMLRGMGLGPMELSLWYARNPEAK